MLPAATDIKSRPRRPGNFNATRCTCPQTGCVDILITQADPYVHVSPQFLETVRARKGGQWTHLDGDVLTIAATNRTVRYRIPGPTPSWPRGDTVVYEAELLGS